MIYQLSTIVDITETKTYHGSDQLKINQQQNFNTIIQTIGLCGNVYYQESPKYINNKWYFEWTMEIEELFRVDDDHTAKLSTIFDYVPFIPTSDIYTRHYFLTNYNIWFDSR